MQIILCKTIPENIIWLITKIICIESGFILKLQSVGLNNPKREIYVWSNDCSLQEGDCIYK